MRIVVQRTLRSSVEVNENLVSKIEQGMVLFVCLEKEDTQEQVEKAVQKISSLRIFKDPETDKMSKDIKDVEGEVLAISQFTLSWRGEKGNRPSFDHSMEPNKAKELFDKFVGGLRDTGIEVKTGLFGAHMKVQLINDGPVTFCLDF